MSIKIDPKDVLLYLNELGYTNISAQQLKEFIIDLKKIIKYENKRRKHLEFNEYSNIQTTQSTEYCSDICIEKRKSPIRDIFEILHNLPTEASKAKITTKKEQPPIAIHIKQRKKKIVEHDHCVHLDNVEKPTEINTIEEENNVIDKVTNSNLEVEKHKTEGSKPELEIGSSRVSGQRPNSKQSRASTGGSTKFKKSKTQVLRSTNSNKSIPKTDPVALYHEYQKQWKTIKFPGQENHQDLRWAIREKLMDGPTVEVKRKPSAKKIAFV